MIINFNFNLSKIEFIQQQSNNYFAVDFLMDYIAKRDFASMIKQACENNDELVKILKMEKNYVVLPDDVVGFGNLVVPASRRQSREYFLTKFDLIYNKFKNLVEVEDLYSMGKNSYTYVFCMVKKQIILEIVSAFSELNIKIVGINYYSRVLVDYLSNEHKNLTKDNCILVVDGKKIIAVSKGFVLGCKIIKEENYDFAKKFVEYTKANIKKLIGTNANMDEEIKGVKLSVKNSKEQDEKYELIVDDFVKHYENELGIYFDKNIVEINNVDNNTILLNYKGNSFYDGRKGHL